MAGLNCNCVPFEADRIGETLNNDRAMVSDNHRTGEHLNRFEQLFAIDVMMGVQSLTSTTAVHNVRRIDKRNGVRLLRELSQHF